MANDVRMTKEEAMERFWKKLRSGNHALPGGLSSEMVAKQSENMRYEGGRIVFEMDRVWMPLSEDILDCIEAKTTYCYDPAADSFSFEVVDPEEREALRRFSEHVWSAELPDGLTTDKIAGRASGIRFEDGKVVFEMDRHLPLLAHEPGTRMGAMVESRTIYSYDPAGDSISIRIPERTVHIDDIERCAEICCKHDTVDVSPTESGGWVVTLGDGHEGRTVSNHQEARDFVRGEVEEWELDHYLFELVEHLSPDERAPVEAEFREACVKEMLGKLDYESPMLDEQEQGQIGEAADEQAAETDRMKPFVGENYRSGGLRGMNILILGESSHAPEPPNDISEYNLALAADAIGYDEGRGYWNKSRFYTRIARIFGYNAARFAQRREFWNSVAYYNYLQTVFNGPRRKPAAHLWPEAEEPYLETLRELAPDYVVAFSKRMWQHLPKEAEETVQNDEDVFAVKAMCPHTGTKLVGFKHPTGRDFRWQDVKKVVERLMG